MENRQSFSCPEVSDGYRPRPVYHTTEPNLPSPVVLNTAELTFGQNIFEELKFQFPQAVRLGRLAVGWFQQALAKFAPNSGSTQSVKTSTHTSNTGRLRPVGDCNANLVDGPTNQELLSYSRLQTGFDDPEIEPQDT